MRSLCVRWQSVYPDGLCYIHRAMSIMQIAPREILSSHECMLHTSFVSEVALNKCETPLVI